MKQELFNNTYEEIMTLLKNKEYRNPVFKDGWSPLGTWPEFFIDIGKNTKLKTIYMGSGRICDIYCSIEIGDISIELSEINPNLIFPSEEKKKWNKLFKYIAENIIPEEEKKLSHTIV